MFEASPTNFRYDITVRLLRYIDIFDKYRYLKNIDIRYYIHKYRNFESCFSGNNMLVKFKKLSVLEPRYQCKLDLIL